MRFSIFIVVTVFLACTNSNKIVEKNGKEKVTFNSGNFSGIDYIMITKSIENRKAVVITLDCNHYLNEMGKTLFVRKEIYDDKGKFLNTSHLIRDTVMFLKMNYKLKQDEIVYSSFTNEEYNLIRNAYIKYPTLVRKYNLDADVFKNYLGWVKVGNGSE